MDLPARAPANGLKIMLLVVVLFALVAAYGQWQRAQRAQIIRATVTAAAPTPSPSASPQLP